MDRIKATILEAVQKTLGHQATLAEIVTAIENEYGLGAVTIEHHDLSRSETALIVRGAGGPSRQFVVKVSETM